jgi:glycosyltransferase involved in cell wall biosynthesis
MSDSKGPLVSLVLTTYERPELAKRAIRSMLAQTYKNTEIIVIEDAGETTIESWIEQYDGEISFIRHSENRGLAAARNTGINAASGKYVAFLDDDDEWEPRKTAKQVSRAERLLPDRELGVVYCGARHEFEESAKTKVRMPENDGNLREEIQREGAKTLSSSYLFVRTALLDVDGFDESLPSSIDHDIWMSLAVAGYEVDALEEPLVVKHQSSDRTEMTSDVETRIEGIDQYTQKWRATYCEWFGFEAGNAYADDYFARVIGRLAIRKAMNAEFGAAATALAAVFRRSGLNRNTATLLVRHFLLIFGGRALPRAYKERLKWAYRWIT